MLTLDPEGSPSVGGPVLLGRDGRGLTRAFTRTKTLESGAALGWPGQLVGWSVGSGRNEKKFRELHQGS